MRLFHFFVLILPLCFVNISCGRIWFEISESDREASPNDANFEGGNSGSDAEIDGELSGDAEIDMDAEAVPDASAEGSIQQDGEDIPNIPIACTSENSSSVCNGLPCVDGYCCDLVCDGPCEACNIEGAEGKCTEVPDDADDPFLGSPCDGDDSDLCLDDVYQRCENGKAICSSGSDDVDICDGDDNDCDGVTDEDDPACQTNTAPLARIDIDPPCGTLNTVFEADASDSTDNQDSLDTLTFSWDWDGDGDFDDSSVTSLHQFTTTGSHTVVLNVEDSGGLVSIASFEVLVLEEAELITVTTEEDESDPGATPDDSGGSGFSLREAIRYANEEGGSQTVHLPSGMVVELVSTMETSTDMTGLNLVADGATLDGSNMEGTCLQINGDNNRYFGLEIRNCSGWGIHLNSGSFNQISRCTLHHNDHGIRLGGQDNLFGPLNQVDGSDIGIRGVDIDGQNTVEWNVIKGFRNGALLLSKKAEGSIVTKNNLYANNNGVVLSGLSEETLIAHNTIYNNSGSGVSLVANVENIDLRNNIISNNGQWGIDGDNSSFSALDYNNLFQNSAGDCSSCSELGVNSLAVNSEFVDPSQFDMRLRANSPLVDQGIDLAIDVNGSAPGRYNGASPDIGAYEAP